MISNTDCRLVQAPVDTVSAHLDLMALTRQNAPQHDLQWSCSEVKPVQCQTQEVQLNYNVELQHQQQERNFLRQLQSQLEHERRERPREPLHWQPDQEYHQVRHLPNDCHEQNNQERHRQLWYKRQDHDAKNQLYVQPQPLQWQWPHQHNRVSEQHQVHQVQQETAHRRNELLMGKFNYGRQQRHHYYQERIQQLKDLLHQREQQHRKLEERERQQRECRNIAAADALARAFGHLSQPLIPAGQIETSTRTQENGSSGINGSTILV